MLRVACQANSEMDEEKAKKVRLGVYSSFLFSLWLGVTRTSDPPIPFDV